MKTVKSYLSFGFVFGLSCAAVFGCNAKVQAPGSDEANTEITDEGNEGDTIQVPVSLVDATGRLALANASTYNISVTGCVSGYTGTATQATAGGLTVYKFDQNCVAKLTQFSANGITYAPTNPGATDFTTWQANDTATFSDSTGVYKITVIVSSQLQSPIQASDTISYAYSEVELGSAFTISSAKVQEGHTVSVGGDMAPDFTVRDVTFVSMDAGGAGTFKFNLECNVTQSATPDCNSVPLTATSYVLVKDTFGGAPTVSQLSAMFPGTAIVVPTNVLSGAQTPNSRGGFQTANLMGPAQIHLNPAMLLVLKNGASFQYFPVNVSVIASAQ